MSEHKLIKMGDIFDSSAKNTFGSPTFGSPTSGSPMSASDCLSPGGVHRNFFGLVFSVTGLISRYPEKFFRNYLKHLPVKERREAEASIKNIWFGLKELSARDKGIDKGQYTEVQGVFNKPGCLKGKTQAFKSLIYNGFALLEQKTSEESRQQTERKSRRKGKKSPKPNGGGGSTGIMPLSPADSLSPNGSSYGMDSWNHFEWEINEVPVPVAEAPVLPVPVKPAPMAKAPVKQVPEVPVSDPADDSDTPSDWEDEDC